MKPPFSNFSRGSADGKHLMRFQSETSVSKFLRRSVDGKHLMRFQSETSVFKFLWRSVDGKHLMRFQSDNAAFKFLPYSVNGTINTHQSQDPLEHQPREQNIGKQSHTLYHSCLYTHLTQSPAELQSRHGQLQTSERSSWLGSLGRGFPNPPC